MQKKKNDSATTCKITVSSVNFDLHTPQSFFPVPLYVHTRNFFHVNSRVLIHRTLEITTKERIIHIRPINYTTIVCKSHGDLREFLCVIHDNYIIRTFCSVYMTGTAYLLQSNFLPRSNFVLHFKMRNKPLCKVRPPCFFDSLS